MMDLSTVFSLFSRRDQQAPESLSPIPETFRFRLVLLCLQKFGTGTEISIFCSAFWEEINRHMMMLLGQLIAGRIADAPTMPLIADYVMRCSDEHVFDFIELIFRVPSYASGHHTLNENEFVDQVSDLLLADNLPYAVSPFVRDRQGNSIRLVSYPKVILRDNEFAYSELIEPTIDLLSEAGFSSANGEFLEALEDYRKGDYGDCLTKCGSAFESTMKIACDRNGWAYDQNDSASTLVHTVVTESGLESYLETPLIVIATLRNRLSKSHGAGTQPRNVPASRVRYTINATASAMLLLVDHIRERSR